MASNPVTHVQVDSGADQNLISSSTASNFKILDVQVVHTNWVKRRVQDWSPTCLSSCLHSAPMGQSLLRPQEVTPDLTKVPTEYHDLQTVFSKSPATSLPPHRPYDCAMDLLPGISPPMG